MKKPKHIDTVEKLISLNGNVQLECTNIFKQSKKYYLERFGWYGPYETILYNAGSDMYCIYNEETKEYDDIDIQLAYELALKELRG